MKLTNKETSLKLQELGFKADFEYCYDRDGDKDNTQLWSKCFELDVWDDYTDEKFIPAFDLETILDFLPEVINGIRLEMHFATGLRIGYKEGEFQKQLMCYKLKDETLATTAAKLLLKLGGGYE